MQIQRTYQDLAKKLKPNHVFLLYGPRRVGKTTLITEFLKKTTLKYKFDTGDNFSTQEILSIPELSNIKDYVGNYELIVIDEAQKIKNIGSTLKLMTDHIPDLKIIATGSSSFELAGQIGEPLTGRKFTYKLFPISQMELKNHYSPFEIKQNLEHYMVYGTYPNVITANNSDESRQFLEELVGSYLLKDILELEQLKDPKILRDLLKLLAFQIGNEVSLNEIGKQLGISSKTVGRYLDLLEKNFIIYNLRGFSQNLRKEITKKSKYYFFDNGIRNTLISNFNTLNNRNDQGQLWENFIVIERLKKRTYNNLYANDYFWRTWEQQEIDLIEESNGQLNGYEFKFNKKKTPKPPSDWVNTYPNSTYQVINTENYLDFIT
jgi:predicted AAA+ superfamily ATPase